MNIKFSVPAPVKLAFLLGVIACAVYANTFKNDFAYDDISVVRNNTIVARGVAAIPEILTTPYRWGFFVTTNDMYRPLSLVMFAVEYQLSGGSPAPMHMVNVLLFAGCVILLFLFLDGLFDRKKTAVAFITSLFFALHPIHTEVVANIKSRDEILCFFFAFLSLNIFLTYAQSGKKYQLIAGAMCFLLSIFSKETAITFLAVVPFIFFFYRNERTLRSTLITTGCMVGAAVFLIVRFSVLNNYNANHLTALEFMDNALSKAPSLPSRLATAILVLGKYLQLLLIPYPLVCDYGYCSIPFVSFGNMRVLLSLAVYIALTVVGIYRLVKYPKDLFAFGILFFLCTLSVFSNIFFLIGAEMGERFLFFASSGFCLVLALIIEKWVGGSAAGFVLLKKPVVLSCIIAISLVYTVLTVNRNGEWKDSLTLYSADLKKSPDDARLYYFLANEMLIAGEDKDMATRLQIANDAIHYVKKAVEIYPDYSEAHKVLGNGYFFTQQYDSSIVHYNRAIALRPDDIEAMNNLNVAYFSAKQYHNAIDVCRELISKDRSFTEGYNSIAICYMNMGKYDSAVYVLDKALEVAPGYNRFYENLALAYKLAGNNDSAKKYESVAQQHNTNFHVF